MYLHNYSYLVTLEDNWNLCHSLPPDHHFSLSLS